MRRLAETDVVFSTTSTTWVDVLIVAPFDVPPGPYYLQVGVESFEPIKPAIRVLFEGQVVCEGDFITAEDTIHVTEPDSKAIVQARSPMGTLVTVERFTLILEGYSPLAKPVTLNYPLINIPVLYLESERSVFRVLRPDKSITDATEEDIQNAISALPGCDHSKTIVAGSSKAEVRLRCFKCGSPVLTLYDHLKE